MSDINATTTVKDLLATHPDVFPILVRHGMCEDCKADPPPVPLGHFADKHCGGNLTGLIDEMRQVIGAQ